MTFIDLEDSILHCNEQNLNEQKVSEETRYTRCIMLLACSTIGYFRSLL